MFIPTNSIIPAIDNQYNDSSYQGIVPLEYLTEYQINTHMTTNSSPIGIFKFRIHTNCTIEITEIYGSYNNLVINYGNNSIPWKYRHSDFELSNGLLNPETGLLTINFIQS